MASKRNPPGEPMTLGDMRHVVRAVSISRDPRDDRNEKAGRTLRHRLVL
jgi:hypothetical protein